MPYDNVNTQTQTCIKIPQLITFQSDYIVSTGVQTCLETRRNVLVHLGNKTHAIVMAFYETVQSE
jgi:hypothetical protein